LRVAISPSIYEPNIHFLCLKMWKIPASIPANMVLKENDRGYVVVNVSIGDHFVSRLF
jgi:hypothetical protein